MPNEEGAKKIKILVIDDEEINIEIIQEFLGDHGFEIIAADNGLTGLDQLEKNPDVEAIILDRMMPVMGGMQFMELTKRNENFRNIPIIMQTAASTSEQIREGIEAGVFYYLTKPYQQKTLLAILRSAIEQSIVHKRLNNDIASYKIALSMINTSSFTFRTLDEAKHLSFLVSRFFPESDKVLFGLNEITVNAIEHGNLGINFDIKRKLLDEGAWQSEITKRLADENYADKYAELRFESTPDYFEVRIKDMGTGFDFAKYLYFDASRMTAPNGRGIAMSRMYSFDDIEFLGNGNEVICRVNKDRAKRHRPKAA